MPGFVRPRIWNRLQPALAAGALLCVLGAGGAIAYYTTMETPPPAAPSKLRYAEGSDNWTDALRTPEFWNRMRSRSRSSDESGSSRRSRRNESARSSRSRDRDSERASTRRQTVVREQPSRPIRESTREHTIVKEHTFRPIREWTEPYHRTGGTIRYYSFIPKEIATYYTMCVRLCDGYYWPISHSATRREFGRDSEICQRSCESPAALFTYRNFGEEPENMVDLQGHPYIGLDTAFQYRATYNEACKCRPHPWEPAARQRHLSYQADAQAQPAAVKKP